jgi:hypothetical protein
VIVSIRFLAPPSLSTRKYLSTTRERNAHEAYVLVSEVLEQTFENASCETIW